MDYKYKQAALGVSSNTMKSIKELVTGSATGTITSELKPLAMQLFLASSRGANTAGGENALVRRVQSKIDKWEKSTDIDSPFSKQLPNSKMTIRQAYRGGKGVTAQQQAEAKQMIMDLVLREAGIQGDTNFPAVQARMQGTVGQGAAGRVAGRMDEAMKMHPNK